MNGLLIINKPKGYTSHDVVNVLRKKLNTKKIGHTGTLDPNATGVLQVLVGTATKVSKYLVEHEKTYVATIKLGKKTDTGDVEGKIIEEDSNLGDIDKNEVEEVIKSFLGKQSQIPPMYSAIKVDGKKLYEYAREGKTVERKARNVQIFSIEILEMNLPRVRMSVHCSKGTYIRTLCHDIGAMLGCGGCMEKLLRTKVGVFELQDTLKLAEIDALAKAGDVEKKINSVDELFEDYTKVWTTPEFDVVVHNGNRVKKRMFQEKLPANTERLRVYDSKSEFIGIYEFSKERGDFKPVKMFYETIK